MRNLKESNFCYYPFMQILVTSDGKYRPCSKHQDYITDNGRELRVDAGDTLQDAWNSTYMTDIRTHFLEDKQFAGCRECWRMQKMGLRSMRYDSVQYAGSNENQVNSLIAPTRIEINASNVCNLKCRICYPNASTKWIPEAEALYGKKEKVYQNLNLPNLEQVKNWSDSLEEVCFFGGEPLLSKENIGLMDHFIQSGNAHRISLLFNTNGTVFSEEIVEKIVQFKKVRMYFSIDDIGERFEYQRSGAKWPEVEQNIGKAYELSRSDKGKNIEFKICCTVSALNIYYFPEFFDYFNNRFPGLMIFWNLLFDPWRLSVQLLPEEIKDKIQIRLKEQVNTTYEMSEEETKTVEELVTFLDQSIEKPFDEFFRYVHRHDLYRKESFPHTFPEFWEVIRSYVPQHLDFGSNDVPELLEKAKKELASGTEEAMAEAEKKVRKAARVLVDSENAVDTEGKWSIFEAYRDTLSSTELLAVFFAEIFQVEGGVNNVGKAYLELVQDSSIANGKPEDRETVARNLSDLFKVWSIDTSGKLSKDLLQTDKKEFYENLSKMTRDQLEQEVERHYGLSVPA